MTEIEKTESEIAVLQSKLELLKEIETHKSQPRMTLESAVEGEVVSYNDEIYYRLDLPDEVYWYISKRDDNGAILLKQITDGETHRLLEGLWFNDVKHGKYDDVVDEPENYDEVEWDEKDNPKPMDEVVDRLENKWNSAAENSASYMTDEVIERVIKKWEENPPSFLRFELGKTLEALITDWVDEFVPTYSTWDSEVDIAVLIQRIEKWLPEPQSHEGTQSVSVIDLVDGYNDALTKIKSKLRNKK